MPSIQLQLSDVRIAKIAAFPLCFGTEHVHLAVYTTEGGNSLMKAVPLGCLVLVVLRITNFRADGPQRMYIGGTLPVLCA